jgi:2,5-furandicarboxylate decarboxylase 1
LWKDVDNSSWEEIAWAVATRFQAGRDLVVVSSALDSKLDPITDNGIGSKMGLDATVPVGRREDFMRIHVKGEEEEVDLVAVLRQDAHIALRCSLDEVPQRSHCRIAATDAGARVVWAGRPARSSMDQRST